MKKLLRGIVDFRKNVRPTYKDTFAKLALGQQPDALFIACSDSRVAPNVFASTDPGDMFVVRNVGNFVPPCGDEHGTSGSDVSEAAAVEFALLNLPVTSIIVCGHSECGAMKALVQGRKKLAAPNLRSWLRHGEESVEGLNGSEALPHVSHLEPHNRLSQLNVLKQIEHLMGYPLVRERVEAGKLTLYGWWFDIKNADVYLYDEKQRRFVLIDEEVVRKVADDPKPQTGRG